MMSKNIVDSGTYWNAMQCNEPIYRGVKTNRFVFLKEVMRTFRFTFSHTHVNYNPHPMTRTTINHRNISLLFLFHRENFAPNSCWSIKEVISNPGISHSPDSLRIPPCRCLLGKGSILHVFLFRLTLKMFKVIIRY